MKKFFKKYTPDKTVVDKYKILRLIGAPLLHKELWQFSKICFCKKIVTLKCDVEKQDQYQKFKFNHVITELLET